MQSSRDTYSGYHIHQKLRDLIKVCFFNFPWHLRLTPITLTRDQNHFRNRANLHALVHSKKFRCHSTTATLLPCHINQKPKVFDKSVHVVILLLMRAVRSCRSLSVTIRTIDAFFTLSLDWTHDIAMNI